MPKKIIKKKRPTGVNRRTNMSHCKNSVSQERYRQWLSDPKRPCEPMHEELESFTENPNWRIFRIMAEFIEGFEFLDKFHGEVTIFGSSRTKEKDPYYRKARKLGGLLGESGYTVITGGGPGIMEAANRGAYEVGAESVGLDIELPTEQRRNEYVTSAIGFHYFFTRKVMLSASAQAYVYFPGGFGTLDELSEMITLTQTKKIPANVPSILVGREYWAPLMDWIRNTVLKHGNIAKKDLDLFHVVDTPEEAMKIIKKTTERPYGSERNRVFKGFRSSAK